MKIDTINSPLLKGISQNSWEKSLERGWFIQREFPKESALFSEGENCKGIFILLEGKVQVERTTLSGNRILVNTFQERGTVFGEVYGFLGGRLYDFSCIAARDTKVLFLHLEAFSMEEEMGRILSQNMLGILAKKALFLNRKLLIHGGTTLRQKIAIFLLQQERKGKVVNLTMNREQWADYLGVARPSLSRQLMEMEKESLIKVEKNKIFIEEEKLEKIAY
ncbi:Crp/Fnr family transcriptional regulator [Peptoniphilus sp. KCTC 25270]|uniref:Crp/Fnr family transcriptional regulator n=1 Tax=Peptoniphilus sp. KCTC 25270 TaxID=2897414 RepID=UPI001E36EFDD|nr:Crp/Fnr family transcriptional regulator [Peptoniphilus sp. KCTC 25270]MCD1147405.1 Crp/Fnr family transcriptional regulator [Peptoniphilus sp. KCTC 25270]